MGTFFGLAIGTLLGGGAIWFYWTSRSGTLIALARAEETARAAADLQRESNARATAETVLVKEREAAQERVRLIEDSQARLKEAFQALSADALSQNNKTFMDLAKLTLEKFQEGAQGDLAKRQEAINHLVDPVNESLKSVQKVIEGVEKERIGAYEGLHEQVRALLEAQTELRAEASGLRRALSAPQRSGRWGELQLRKVVELAGMSKHCDFHEQKTHTTEDEKVQRPDLIVNMPGGRTIVVDAKTVVERYLEAMEAPDEAVRKLKLEAHAAHVTARVEQLSAKEYWKQFPDAPDFVVLFLPGENFFSAALEHNPALFEQAFQKKVLIATPVTLIALLKAGSFGWRQEALAENAAKISALGRELYERVATMAEHMTGLGKTIGQAVSKYNQLAGSLEQRVLPSARKFPELGVSAADNPITSLTPIELAPRELQAPELITKETAAETQEA